jgi:hypothetical protein
VDAAPDLVMPEEVPGTDEGNKATDELLVDGLLVLGTELKLVNDATPSGNVSTCSFWCGFE